MSESPRYGLNRNPQFSTNQMSSYLACQNATQRTRVIQEAKYPSKNQVSSYGAVRKPLRNALHDADFGSDDLVFWAGKMAERERQASGQAKNNARLAGLAIEAFRETFTPRRFRNLTFAAASGKLAQDIEGVRLNVSLDAAITVEADGVMNAGGLILIYAFGADRSDIRDRQAAAASLILWTLEGGQIEPLPRLCMAVDLHDHHVAKATSSHARFRDRVRYSCAEVAARWDAIRPPHDYDGPHP